MTVFNPYSDWFAIGNKTLDMYAMRNQAFAQDIANVNTPGYKVTEVPFPDQLASLLEQDDEEDLADKQAREMRPMRERKRDPMSDMDRIFGLSSNLFDHDIAPLETFAATADVPRNPRFEQDIAEVEFQPRRVTAGFMRADGNNVSIDKTIIGYTHNAILYKGMIDEMAGTAKEVKTILSGG